MVAPPSTGGAASPPPKVEKKPPPEPTKIEATPVKEKPLPPPEPEPPPKVEPKPVKETPPPEPPPQVVSLKSQHQVKKIPPEPPKPEVVKPPKKDEKAVRRELDKLREHLAKEQQQRELSQVRKQLAQEEKLRKEAQAADAEAAKLMNDLAALKAQSRIMEAREQGLGSGPASSSADSALAQQYYARITGQLKSLWKLPDYKDWPSNLLATVIVTLDKSGKILDVQFEKRSGDSAFDRLVRKTLDDADPLPPIPPAMKKERLEIGLNFKPGSITGR